MSANAAFNHLLLLPEFTGSMDAFWFFLLYLLLIVVTASEERICSTAQVYTKPPRLG